MFPGNVNGLEPFDPDFRSSKKETLRKLRLKFDENELAMTRMRKKLTESEEKLAVMRLGHKAPSKSTLADSSARSTSFSQFADPEQAPTSSSVSERLSIALPGPNIAATPSKSESKLIRTMDNCKLGLRQRKKAKRNLWYALTVEENKLQRWTGEALKRRADRRKKMEINGVRWSLDEKTMWKENEQTWGALGMELYPELWEKKPIEPSKEEGKIVDLSASLRSMRIGEQESGKTKEAEQNKKFEGGSPAKEAGKRGKEVEKDPDEDVDSDNSSVEFVV